LLRTFGRLSLIAAAAISGYLVWMLWGTGLITARAQADLRTKFQQRVANPRPQDQFVRIPGNAVAEIIIPRIDLDMIVVDSTDPAALTKGPGLYPNSALPWQDRGKVAIAGHRTTYLHPFWSLDKMRKGDLIQLATEYGTFDYRVTRVETVLPTATQVADQTEKPTLILTTCTPRFSASHRLVVFADRE